MKELSIEQQIFARNQMRARSIANQVYVEPTFAAYLDKFEKGEINELEFGDACEKIQAAAGIAKAQIGEVRQFGSHQLEKGEIGWQMIRVAPQSIEKAMDDNIFFDVPKPTISSEVFDQIATGLFQLQMELEHCHRKTLDEKKHRALGDAYTALQFRKDDIIEQLTGALGHTYNNLNVSPVFGYTSDMPNIVADKIASFSQVLAKICDNAGIISVSNIAQEIYGIASLLKYKLMLDQDDDVCEQCVVASDVVDGDEDWDDSPLPVVAYMFKAMDNFFEKGGKKAVIGEIRKFGGREYIKTATGWQFHGKGTGKKASQAVQAAGALPMIKNANDHVIANQDGSFSIDTLDPDTEKPKFKTGEKVKFEDPDGKIRVMHVGPETEDGVHKLYDFNKPQYVSADWKDNADLQQQFVSLFQSAGGHVVTNEDYTWMSATPMKYSQKDLDVAMSNWDNHIPSLEQAEEHVQNIFDELMANAPQLLSWEENDENDIASAFKKEFAKLGISVVEDPTHKGSDQNGFIVQATGSGSGADKNDWTAGHKNKPYYGQLKAIKDAYDKGDYKDANAYLRKTNATMRALIPHDVFDRIKSEAAKSDEKIKFDTALGDNKFSTVKAAKHYVSGVRDYRLQNGGKVGSEAIVQMHDGSVVATTPKRASLFEKHGHGKIVK